MVKAFLLGVVAFSLLWATGGSATAATVSPKKPQPSKAAVAAKPVAKASPAKAKVVSLLIESFNGDTDVAAIAAALKTSKQDTLQQAVLPQPQAQNKPLVSNKPE